MFQRIGERNLMHHWQMPKSNASEVFAEVSNLLRYIQDPIYRQKWGQLQASIPGGKVKDMLEGNRILYEGKQHAVCLLICTDSSTWGWLSAPFRDASFATANKLSSRQGTLIFSTSSSLGENQKAVVCPMAWSSRKIPRVVTSTLSAEAIALSHTLDRLSFIRISWEWLKNPSIDWASPEGHFGKCTQMQRCDWLQISLRCGNKKRATSL